MKIDFHVHSTASDGTVEPEALAAAAKGFAAIALTDHDNLDGVARFSAACVANGVPVAAGTELSIDPGEGFDLFHLLALGVDPANPGLNGLLRRVLDGRNERNERIFGNFARIGIEIDALDIARYAHGEVLARPHFARWLADHGYAPDVKTAFEKYMLPDSPAATRCYEERWNPPQEETFRIVHEAGGICVMAHPKYWRRSWKATGVDFTAVELELSALREKGLDGIEALYQANLPEEDVGFVRLAKKHGLLMTAGSDFHGSNKPSISLGMEVSDDFARPVLEALSL